LNARHIKKKKKQVGKAIVEIPTKVYPLLTSIYVKVIYRIYKNYYILLGACN